MEYHDYVVYAIKYHIWTKEYFHIIIIYFTQLWDDYGPMRVQTDKYMSVVSRTWGINEGVTVSSSLQYSAIPEEHGQFSSKYSIGTDNGWRSNV